MFVMFAEKHKTRQRSYSTDAYNDSQYTNQIY